MEKVQHRRKKKKESWVADSEGKEERRDDDTGGYDATVAAPSKTGRERILSSSGKW